MAHKATVVERLFSVVILGAFIFYVLPNWHPTSLFSTFLVVAVIAVTAFGLGKYFSGEGGRRYLILVSAVVLLFLILFAFTPLGH